MGGAARLAALALLLPHAMAAQAPLAGRPRLVVVIGVDQLRPDYLDRFRLHFGPGGFNLLLDRGARFTQAKFEHGTTSTCPGYAAMLTGSYADVNGIVGNAWFDRAAGRSAYCAADSAERVVGAAGPGRSPRNLRGGTVGDVLEVATGGASRVLTVSAKDRAAIMLGGHLADAAYWLSDTLFVTSSYYRRDLPAWVREFNASGAVTAVAGRRWDRLLPAAAYQTVGPDDAIGEADPSGMGRAFPHPIGHARAVDETFIQAFQRSPFSNDVLADFAMRAMRAEGLGRDSVPDLLAIGFSANDGVGHAYGPASHEVMDVTVRLDRTLARLFGFLDRTVGLERVLVVLTSDHGVAPIPEVVRRLRPGTRARRISPDVITGAVNAALEARYGAPRRAAWVAHHDFPNVYLNREALAASRISVQQAERVAAEAVAAVPGVHEALTASDLARQRAEGARTPAALSFHPGRSGDVYYQLEPYLMVDAGSTGTDHGTRWAYDQHVPLLWLGAGIRPGVHHVPAAVADIAPTLSALLGLVPPGGAQGRVLWEMLR